MPPRFHIVCVPSCYPSSRIQSVIVRITRNRRSKERIGANAARQICRKEIMTESYKFILKMLRKRLWIKEGKEAVKMTRLSGHRFRSNQIRLAL